MKTLKERADLAVQDYIKQKIDTPLKETVELILTMNSEALENARKISELIKQEQKDRELRSTNSLIKTFFTALSASFLGTIVTMSVTSGRSIPEILSRIF